MRVFFLAEKPCVLTVNGVYLGTVDGFERSVSMDPADRVICELKPFGFHTVRFCFGEDFLFLPPQGVALYHTRRGVAVYAHGFLRENAALSVIRQERIGGTLLTLYTQGGVQLSMENETGFHILTLPDEMEEAVFLPVGNCYLLESPSCFCILSRNGELKVKSEGVVLERGEKVCAEVPFHDSQGHTAVCIWEEGVLKECSIRTPNPPTEATFALALFESVQIGAEIQPFLAPNLAEKADALKEYLGNFLSVVLTEKQDEVGLVYERNARVYDVRYFRVETDGGKIRNIIRLED